MEGIQTRISMYDNISSVLSSITSRLDSLANGFNSTQSDADSFAAGAQFNEMAQQIEQAHAKVEETNQTIEEQAQIISGLKDHISQIESEQEKYNQRLQQGHGLADTLKSKVAGIASALGMAFGLRAAVNFLKESVSLTDTQIQAEQQLANVLANQGASEAEFIALKKEAANIQNRSTFGDQAMLGGAAEISTYIKDAEAVQSMMGTLSNYAAGMSGGAAVSYQQMVDYATQLGKALDGTYDGLKKKGFELSDVQKQIIENGTDMEKALVIDEVINQSWAGLAEQMAQTPAGMREKVANAITNIREKLGSALYPQILNLFTMIEEHLPQIEMLINLLVPALQFIIDLIGKILEVAFGVYQFFADNWSQIAPIVTALAVAVGIFTVAVIAYKVAQWAANAALYACPIVWILLIIIGIVAAVYAVIAAINHFADTSISATGVIFGAFSVLGAALWNIFLGCADIILGVLEWLINPIIGWVNFFQNVFKDPVSAVLYLFQGMADGILGLLEKIASALDTIFGTNMAASVAGWREGLKASVDSLVESRGFNPSDFKTEALDLGSVKDLGLNRLEYGAAWESGYNAGESFENSIKDFDPASLIPEQNNVAWGGSSESAATESTAQEIAGNTGAMASMSEENLKYLRDIAERDTVNRFTTAEVSVTFGDVNNNVSSINDLDGIVDYIADNLQEALEVVAEGVG